MKDTARLDRLRDRALMLARSRAFFLEHDVLEVDCPALCQAASVDLHIDLIASTKGRYLHSSPEYGMKRLLAEGIGDCFQLAHVFRDEEKGELHNPEFTLVEWYRLGMSYEELIQETLDFVALFCGDKPREILTYTEVFKRFAQLDIWSSDEADLKRFAQEQCLPIYPGIEEEGKDGWLNLIMASYLERFLGQDVYTVVSHYPASQAMLAQIKEEDGQLLAERFEIFHKGWELANGYNELADAQEQRQRLMQANNERKRLGKPTLPIDELFLEALEKGLPPCCGVAVGFDRLMMLRHGVKEIDAVIPFSWDKA